MRAIACILALLSIFSSVAAAPTPAAAAPSPTTTTQTGFKDDPDLTKHPVSWDVAEELYELFPSSSDPSLLAFVEDAKNTICVYSQQGCKGVEYCYRIPIDNEAKATTKTNVYKFPENDLEDIQNDGSRTAAGSWRMPDRDLTNEETLRFYLAGHLDSSTLDTWVPQTQWTQGVQQGTCENMQDKVPGAANQFNAMTYTTT